MKQTRRKAILVTERATGKKMLFTSVTQVVETLGAYSVHTLYKYLSRKKTYFEDHQRTIEKVEYQK